MVAHNHNPLREAMVRGWVSVAGPGKTARPCLKIKLKKEEYWDLAQVIEHLSMRP
jgi:hypothetical protein